MPVRVVESKDNPRLKELRKALAHPCRGAQHHVGIEGPHLLEEALRAGLHVTTAFVAHGAESLLDGLPLPQETEILHLPRKLLEAALTTETPQPVAALVEAPDWSWENILRPGDRRPLILLLAGLQDPGNLGTILRSGEAFGATGAVSLPGTVSAWNPKAVRASAGSVLRFPVLTVNEQECLEELRNARVTTYATTVNGARPAESVDMTAPVAFIIGNEGSGVAEELAAKANSQITIPCPGPVESLNAAVAASVLLYEAARQRVAARIVPTVDREARR